MTNTFDYALLIAGENAIERTTAFVKLVNSVSLAGSGGYALGGVFAPRARPKDFYNSDKLSILDSLPIFDSGNYFVVAGVSVNEPRGLRRKLSRIAIVHKVESVEKKSAYRTSVSIPECDGYSVYYAHNMNAPCTSIITVLPQAQSDGATTRDLQLANGLSVFIDLPGKDNSKINAFYRAAVYINNREEFTWGVSDNILDEFGKHNAMGKIIKSTAQSVVDGYAIPKSVGLLGLTDEGIVLVKKDGRPAMLHNVLSADVGVPPQLSALLVSQAAKLKAIAATYEIIAGAISTTADLGEQPEVTEVEAEEETKQDFLSNKEIKDIFDVFDSIKKENNQP